MPINSTPNIEALLALKQDIDEKDQPNGYVGLDNNGYITGEVILRESTGSDVPSLNEFVVNQGRIAIGDGSTIGGNVISGNEEAVFSLYRPSDGIVVVSRVSGSDFSVYCETSSGQYAIDWWDGTRTLHNSGNTASKASSNNALKIIKIYPATTGQSITVVQFGADIGIEYIGIDNLPNLFIASCFLNNLTSINLSRLPSLGALTLSDNSISKIDLSEMPLLETLEIDRNPIGNLSLSGLPLLSTLGCASTNISSLDLSNSSNLTYLVCAGTNITSLDATNCPLLTLLDCNSCASLVSLNVDFLSNLNRLLCPDCALTSIQASGVILSYVYYGNGSDISNNLLSADALNQFFTDLGEDVGATGVIDVTGNPGAATCDPTIATVKGYTIIGA